MAERSNFKISSFGLSRPDENNETASAVILGTVSGSHQFNIIGYSLAKGIGVGNFLTSGTFHVGGYDWQILYYPDGFETDQDRYPSVALFLKLVSPPETDVRAMLSIGVINHNDGSVQPKPKASRPITFNRGKSRGGYRSFMTHSHLEASEYLKDDCVIVKCFVHVVKSSPNRLHSHRYSDNTVGFPPSKLSEHFGKLLESKEGADVTFDVQGQHFRAHRCVLAARSSVFKAELFGSMSERNTDCIEIGDMTASTFEELLHFVYTDSLSSSFELGDEESVLIAQHLLVAADRYALERLRSICEDTLCKSISAETVATTLALADQHNCTRLKTACLKFLEMPEILLTMMLSDGFEHLKISCPSIIKELREKLSELTDIRRVLHKLSITSSMVE